MKLPSSYLLPYIMPKYKKGFQIFRPRWVSCYQKILRIDMTLNFYIKAFFYNKKPCMVISLVAPIWLILRTDINVYDYLYSNKTMSIIYQNCLEAFQIRTYYFFFGYVYPNSLVSYYEYHNINIPYNIKRLKVYNIICRYINITTVLV